jgi:hypothetical protein
MNETSPNLVALVTVSTWPQSNKMNSSQGKLPKIAEFCLHRVDVMIIIFGDFCQFSAKKLAFFSKTNIMISFFQKLAVV